MKHLGYEAHTKSEEIVANSRSHCGLRATGPASGDPQMGSSN